MNRQEAIEHIWGLSGSVASDFCCCDEERAALDRDTREALKALGVEDA